MVMQNTDLPVDAATRSNVIDGLLHKLRTYYVFPAVATQIKQMLVERVGDGAYNTITTAAALCNKLTADAQAISHDQHLYVKYTLVAQSRRENVHADPNVADEWQRTAIIKNFDIRSVMWLPGNIGYLDLPAFADGIAATEALAAAMTLLARTSALIIDLRHNGGGSLALAALLASYLFDAPVHLFDVYWRRGDATRPDGSTQQFWTLPALPGPRYTTQPVYILTSEDTFSIAELFAGSVQQRQRATIIGAPTPSGTNPGNEYQLTPYFYAFIPIGCSMHPGTDTPYADTAVVPDIGVPPAAALDRAHREALMPVLERIGSTPTDPLKALMRDEAQKALCKLGQP